jgi:hypothetical protein
MEHQLLYSLMGECGFIDALGLTFICVVGNIEISDPRNTERVSRRIEELRNSTITKNQQMHYCVLCLY